MEQREAAACCGVEAEAKLAGHLPQRRGAQQLGEVALVFSCHAQDGHSRLFAHDLEKLLAPADVAHPLAQDAAHLQRRIGSAAQRPRPPAALEQVAQRDQRLLAEQRVFRAAQRLKALLDADEELRASLRQPASPCQHCGEVCRAQAVEGEADEAVEEGAGETRAARVPRRVLRREQAEARRGNDHHAQLGTNSSLLSSSTRFSASRISERARFSSSSSSQ